MRSKIFMYLFFFAVLYIIFQYANEKSIFESQDKKITSLTEKSERLTDSLNILQDQIAELNYFTLQGNENAMTYIENLGMESTEVEALVSDAILEQNLIKGGNPLIPMEGMQGEMRVNKIKFLNHRWVLADFSDGSFWGEMLIEYFFDENNKLELTTLDAVLYPN
ncbi:MAG: hydrolase [Flavobacteriaceae bacterium]|nr:hydrolase [Flavobacteriaceae bacterium]